MSESNEQSQQVTIPVTVTSRKDVSRPTTYSKKSVLFINTKGHAHMLPEDMAQSRVKQSRGYIMDKNHKDYLKYFKMAVGYDEKIGTKKFLQKGGRVMSIEDASRVDIESMVQRETLEAEKARKETGGK